MSPSSVSALTASSLLFSNACFADFHSYVQQQLQQLQDYGVVKPAKQTIGLAFTAQTGWRIIDIQNTAIGSAVSLTPPGQNLSNWSELILTKIIPYGALPNISAKRLYQIEVENAQKYCQQVDNRILKQTSKYIIYKLDVNGCPNGDNQRQIGKIFNGIDAVYGARYSAMLGQVSDAEYQKMIPVITHSKLVANPSANN